MRSPSHTAAFITLVLLCIWHTAEACPTNQSVHTVCRCESSDNGILLDCSGRPMLATLTILRANQPQLGLIRRLTLQNASVNALPAQFLQGLYVKNIDLSMNGISRIDRHAFKGSENILQSVILSRNNLTAAPTLSLNSMVELTSLDLSNNSIGDLEYARAFRNMPKLLDLNLGNNKICSIENSVFDDIKQSVQTLNLGNNCLSKVPAPAIRSFQRVIALHLHNNQIEELNQLAFMNMPRLNLINLSGNRIAKLHRQAFLNVPKLRLMYLSDNKLTTIESNQFRHFVALELLDLTENRITIIPKEAFANLPKLTYLYLGQNLIQDIKSEAFRNASTITTLLLPGNKMTAISSEMFTGLTNLQQFSVKNNHIAQVEQNTFYKMPSLVMVDLSYNEIVELAPATFLSQLRMFLVDLSHNRIATTPYSAFNKRIMTIALQENPLVCTERVHILQKGVGVYIPNTVDAICDDERDVDRPTENDGENSVNKFSDGAAFVQETRTVTHRPAGQTISPTTSQQPISPPTSAWRQPISPPNPIWRQPSNPPDPTWRQPIGPPTPSWRQPIGPPTPAQRQRISPPTPTWQQSISPPTRLQPVRYPTHSGRQPVSPPTPTWRQRISPPTRLQPLSPPTPSERQPISLPTTTWQQPISPPTKAWQQPSSQPSSAWPHSIDGGSSGGNFPTNPPMSSFRVTPHDRQAHGVNPHEPTRRLPSTSAKSSMFASRFTHFSHPSDLRRQHVRNGNIGNNERHMSNDTSYWDDPRERTSVSTKLEPGSNDLSNYNSAPNIDVNQSETNNRHMTHGNIGDRLSQTPVLDLSVESATRSASTLPYGAVTPSGIFPFPVPFLSRGTPVQRAYYATTPMPEPTLPPGLIYTAYPPWTLPALETTSTPWATNAPWEDDNEVRPSSEHSNNTPPATPLQSSQRPTVTEDHQFATVAPNDSKSTTTSAASSTAHNSSTHRRPSVSVGPLRGQDHSRASTNNNLPYETSDSDPDASPSTGVGSGSRYGPPGNATVTVAICLSVLVVLVVGVLASLCLARRHGTSRQLRDRSNTWSSGSSAARRTSAYVNAQMHQDNNCYALQHGGGGGTLSRLPLARPAAGGQHAWIYTPSSYSNSNYYM